MKTRSLDKAAPLGLLLLLPSLASADFYQAPFGPGGTWNVYETVGTAATFKDALTAAKAKVDPVNGTVNGTLVSVISQGENDMLRTIRGGADTWIGLSDREGVAVGAQESQTAGTPGNASSGWAWTSGEPFVYKNWGGGEPNNAGDAEDAGQLRGDGFWNDNASGYGLNEPSVPVIQTGTSQAEGTAAFGYVIEYFKQSATPIPGIAMATVLPAAGTIPGPSGGAGTWGVREVTGITIAGNIVDAVNQLKSNAGTSVTAQLPKLDVGDPQTNGQGGSALAGAVTPFLSNTDADDNNLATIAKGKISVTQAGTYTFQVHSDDGFALRVVGQQFDSVNGAGYMDPVDKSTMTFNVGTGDSNTRGVITLAAGEYDLEFVHFEGGGGAYYEVTSAQGAITDANGAQWTAVGDAAVKGARAADVVRLTGAATVANAAKPGDNNLATATAAIEAAIGNNTAVTKAFTTLNIPEADMPIANKDNYATKVTGQIRLDDADGTAGEAIKITFNLQADDGASLRILGKDFTVATDFTGDGVAVLEEVSGDTTLKADYPTGNTNAFGLIELTEGELYDFAAYHSEGGGGSQFQLWYAVGDYTGTGFDPAVFRVLSTGSDAILAANAGLALVPEPSTTGLFGLAALGLLGRRRRK
ncbi:MAG: PEP-CTERM sorting domain-containing protein [Verrucomicrobiaceae bacterium]|nr:MAG: PEP-CTERM sorting domain-containing protein [Verrucomicrobiaceae bacterium]